MHKLLLCCFLLAICPPILYCKLFCRQDGGIVLRQHNYFNRHNLNRHFAAKKAVTAYHCNRFYWLLLCVTPPFHYLEQIVIISKGGTWSGTLPQKRQTHFIRACRLIFINITLSNRIVKPNNRYTRQPVSHDFLFYSAPDKVYVLTATNRIAMRFVARSAPPFHYLTKCSDNAKGGIWGGSQPQKRQTHFIRACRLSYQLYILSNRIVKPNNRYTRQPASHDFPF